MGTKTRDKVAHWGHRLLVVGFVAWVIAAVPATAFGSEGRTVPQVSARAAILVDGRTGNVLYAKNAFQEMDPASLTKIMTAILTIHHGDLNRVVTVSAQAARTEGSRLHIRANQRYSVMDLLRGLLLRSGNDAAVALAEANAGSVTRFVDEMNTTAQQLGAFNTSFANPNGLTASGAYSSAYDLSIITRHALTLPLFRKLVSTREDTVKELGSNRIRTIHNTNMLLAAFPGADGVKTGTTAAAGKCLIASATHNGRQLIAVVLNSANRWQDAAQLLSWGFTHTETLPVVYQGQPLGHLAVVRGEVPEVPLVAGRTLWVTLARGQSPDIRLALPAAVRAPITQGQRVGTVMVVVSGDPLAQGPVIAKTTVSRRVLFWNMAVAWMRWFNYGDGAN